MQEDEILPRAEQISRSARSPRLSCLPADGTKCVRLPLTSLELLYHLKFEKILFRLLHKALHNKYCAATGFFFPLHAPSFRWFPPSPSLTAVWKGSEICQKTQNWFFPVFSSSCRWKLNYQPKYLLKKKGCLTYLFPQKSALKSPVHIFLPSSMDGNFSLREDKKENCYKRKVSYLSQEENNSLNLAPWWVLIVTLNSGYVPISSCAGGEDHNGIIRLVYP